MMGLQPWAEVMGELLAKNLAENSRGIDKYCPFGPNCTYLGNEIPTFVSCSENGLKTSEILASEMKHLDDRATIDRSEATPFLVLHGHGSHFGLEFLRYMNEPAMKWTVCIGIPYGMNPCGRWEMVHNKAEHLKWH